MSGSHVKVIYSRLIISMELAAISIIEMTKISFSGNPAIIPGFFYLHHIPEMLACFFLGSAVAAISFVGKIHATIISFVSFTIQTFAIVSNFGVEGIIAVPYIALLSLLFYIGYKANRVYDIDEINRPLLHPSGISDSSGFYKRKQHSYSG
jgi:hypothetical protein